MTIKGGRKSTDPIEDDLKSPTFEKSRKWVQIGCILVKNMDTFVKMHPNDYSKLLFCAHLSRRKPGFNSPWDYQSLFKNPGQLHCLGFFRFEGLTRGRERWS